jgi:hypothetical protein
LLASRFALIGARGDAKDVPMQAEPINPPGYPGEWGTSRRAASANGYALPATVRLAACAAVALLWGTPANAVDNRDFCVLAQQLATAMEKDIGVWIDRMTRNAGMAVSCASMTVEYTRFTYASSASMNDTWKERKGADWNATHCSSAIWKEAIANGWKIMLTQIAADGGRVSFTARCG